MTHSAFLQGQEIIFVLHARKLDWARGPKRRSKELCLSPLLILRLRKLAEDFAADRHGSLTVEPEGRCSDLASLPHDLKPGLHLVVAGAAAGLPVALIPEEILITTMRDDVVDYLGWDRPTSGLAAQAEGMLSLERETGSIPPGGVAAVSC